jgi:hypothetical protein
MVASLNPSTPVIADADTGYVPEKYQDEFDTDSSSDSVEQQWSHEPSNSTSRQALLLFTLKIKSRPKDAAISLANKWYLAKSFWFALEPQ